MIIIYQNFLLAWLTAPEQVRKNCETHRFAVDDCVGARVIATIAKTYTGLFLYILRRFISIQKLCMRKIYDYDLFRNLYF